jgi:hypothetical protein
VRFSQQAIFRRSQRGQEPIEGDPENLTNKRESDGEAESILSPGRTLPSGGIARMEFRKLAAAPFPFRSGLPVSRTPVSGKSQRSIRRAPQSAGRKPGRAVSGQSSRSNEPGRAERIGTQVLLI